MSNETFASLWNGRKPAQEIAALMGISRSGVSKKAARLGLKSRPGGLPHGKPKMIRCRCQNPNCMKMYFAPRKAPIQPHCPVIPRGDTPPAHDLVERGDA